MRVRRAHFLLASLLAFVPGARAWAASDVSPEAVVAELPFLDTRDPGRIYVDVGRDGQPLRLLFDTGASVSMFSPGAARAAGVAVRALKDTPYRRTTRVGDRDLQFYVDTIRSSDTRSRSGFEYAVLGADFFQDSVVELDFAKRTVRFLDPAHYTTPDHPESDGEAVLPMQLSSGRPVIEVRVEGHPVEVILDTGFQLTAVVSGATARTAGIDVGALVPLPDMDLFAGRTETRFYEAREIELAGTRFAPVPILVAPHGLFHQGTPSESVIGCDLLSRFLVRIDYPRRRIWLRRASDRITLGGVEYAKTRGTGAILADVEKGWIVLHVFDATPAAKLGLRSGDTLLHERAGDAEKISLDEVVESIRAGKPVRVARRMNDAWIDIDLPDDPALHSESEAGQDE